MTLTHHFLPARSGPTRSLAVLLHGFGSNGEAMLGLGNTLSPALPDTSFLAPDAPDPASDRPGGRRWNTIPELDGSSAEEADTRLQASAWLLDAFLDHQLAAHALPSQALALLGFSQGAGLAYEVGPRRPDQLAGVTIAGRMKRKDALAAEILSKPPFLILTETHDRLTCGTELATATDTLCSLAFLPSMSSWQALATPSRRRASAPP